MRGLAAIAVWVACGCATTSTRPPDPEVDDVYVQSMRIFTSTNRPSEMCVIGPLEEKGWGGDDNFAALLPKLEADVREQGGTALIIEGSHVTWQWLPKDRARFRDSLRMTPPSRSDFHWGEILVIDGHALAACRGGADDLEGGAKK